MLRTSESAHGSEAERLRQGLSLGERSSSLPQKLMLDYLWISFPILI